MSTLSPAQQILNSFQKTTLTISGKEVVIHGKSGTLQYLGLTPDSANPDIENTAQNLTISRASYRRARWLGDGGGPTVSGSTFTKKLYPTRDRRALPGRPFQFRAVSDTGGDADGRKVTGTLSIQGAWGQFVGYLEANRPPQSVWLKSPDGAWGDAPVLSDADND